MSLGATSSVVNGQLVHIAPKQGFAPLTFGQTYTGPRFDSRGAVYNVPPVMPSPTINAGTDAGNITGVQPTPTAGGLTKNGNANYFHLTKSPLLWAVGFLAIGLLMMQKIHYGK